MKELGWVEGTQTRNLGYMKAGHSCGRAGPLSGLLCLCREVEQEVELEKKP